MRVTTAVLAALPLAQALLVTRPPTASHAAGMKRPLPMHAATTTTVVGGGEVVTQHEQAPLPHLAAPLPTSMHHHFSSGPSSPPLPPLPLIDDREVLRQSHGFSDEANWLVPGKIMVGRYPGSDPFLPCSPMEQLEGLRDLVQRGRVTTFVCLQGELPSQEKVESWGATLEIGLKGRHGFHWYAGDALRAAEEAGRGCKFVHFPASESGESIQPISRLHLLVQGLKHKVVGKGEVLYIHCWGGCGRTGIVASCLLGELYYPSGQLSGPEEAMAHVNSYFHLRSELALSPHRRSPETEVQVQQVKEYFRRYLHHHPTATEEEED